MLPLRPRYHSDLDDGAGALERGDRMLARGAATALERTPRRLRDRTCSDAWATSLLRRAGALMLRHAGTSGEGCMLARALRDGAPIHQLRALAGSVITLVEDAERAHATLGLLGRHRFHACFIGMFHVDVVPPAIDGEAFAINGDDPHPSSRSASGVCDARDPRAGKGERASFGAHAPSARARGHGRRSGRAAMHWRAPARDERVLGRSGTSVQASAEIARAPKSSERAAAEIV